MARSQSTPRSIRKRANNLVKSGKLNEARDLYISACKDYPASPEFLTALARINRQMGLYSDARSCAHKALLIQPADSSALLEYGAALHSLGQTPDAIQAYRQSLYNDSDNSETHYFLGLAYTEQGNMNSAISEYRETVRLCPTHIEAINNLSALLTNNGHVKESLELLEQARRKNPDSYNILINIARAYLFSGEADKAYKILGNVIHLYPEAAEARSKFLLCMNYLQNPDPQRIYQAHLEWGRLHAGKSENTPVFQRVHGIDAILKIGYLSPDLKNHSVARFIEPVLANHDRNRFNITCYADLRNPDTVSQRLSRHCDNWTLTAGLSDQDLYKKIMEDQIDILFDLAGHTGNNRLEVFARKPAPICISYLGYPNTTGLQTVDYRLTDKIADPPGISDKYYTEKLIRPGECFLCYQPPSVSPDISPPPCLEKGYIGFGSFNNLAKLTPELIYTWASILKTTSDSKIFLKSKAASDPYTRERIQSQFLDHGIEADSVVLTGHQASDIEHLDYYNQVDIALDTFPYNGTTTTCEALWMGVPVVTLEGNVHAARVSSSILSGAGLENLVARNKDEYIDIATRLAMSPESITGFGQELRNRLLTSRICDGKAFTGHLETMLLQIWQEYTLQGRDEA